MGLRLGLGWDLVIRDSWGRDGTRWNLMEDLNYSLIRRVCQPPSEIQRNREGWWMMMRWWCGGKARQLAWGAAAYRVMRAKTATWQNE